MTAGFEKQLPAGHEYIQTFQEYRDRLFGSNRIIIVLKQREGVIWNKDYFSTYKDLTDALFYLPGVARHTLTSLWTPNSRYFEIPKTVLWPMMSFPEQLRSTIWMSNACRV